MNLEGQNITVVGLARAGLAAARFVAEKGARLTVTDVKSEEKLPGVREKLSGFKVRYFLGTHPPEAFQDAKAVIVSPGVPLSTPPLPDLAARGVRVVGDVEFAAPFLGAPTVAITGTNGKSTVTALVGKMLEVEGMKPFVGANFGRPVFEAVGGDFGSLVLELSSYQTETLVSLQPRVAVLLNVTEDHLDRYASFEEYRKAKAKLLALVPPEGTVIVNLDDPACVRSAEGIRAKVLGFTLEGKPAPAGWGRIVEERKKALLPGGEKIDFSKTKLAGRHNVANLLAAIAAARSFGAGKSAIEKAIAEFQGLPHRCEFIAEVKGVRYYDDSKGTNVGAVVECLRGFEGPLILVAGGIGKGGSYAPLAEAARGRVRHAILLGEDRKAIGKALSPVCAVEEVASMEEAVRRAHVLAHSGESVLLSPACASFDMFRDYADRGDKFQQAVRSLS